jgi:Integrin beta chain VWA domain
MSIPIQVSPATNDLTLSRDQTFTEVVKVAIPKSGVIPKVDAYFLADTTSSMRDAIAAVQSGISDVLTQIQSLGADVQFGVGEYKDFPAPDPGRHPYAFAHQCSLSANITQVKAAVDAWTVTSGQDVPENQFYALDQVAEAPGGKIGWRADSRRIIIWFGDAAGHDAVCRQISGLSYDITEASVTAKLVAEKIKVLALSLRSSGAPAGLDDDPKAKATGYQPFCGAPGGTVGQGTRIAKATGGKIVQGVSANTIVETIKTELAAQITAIGNVSLVAKGATASFVQAIAPSAGHGPLSRDQDHQISFDVSWIGTVAATYEDQVFNGSLDVIADGEVIGGKTVKITVPLDEEIPMPRPEDRSGTWMLIHEVTGSFFVVEGYNPRLNLAIRTWPEDPPQRVNGPQQGYLWVLVRQTDGTYLIQTQEGNQPNRLLYLEAPAQPGQRAFPRLQLRNETNDLQSWVLVPFSFDPDTYAIQSKRFPGYTLGLDSGNCSGQPFVVLSNSWGRPTLHGCWRLSKHPAS